MPCSGNGDNPGLFAEHPGQRYLRRRGVMFAGKTMYVTEQLTVLVETLLPELRHGGAVIGARVECGVGIVIGRQQSVAKRRESHESDARLLERRKQGLVPKSPE